MRAWEAQRLESERQAKLKSAAQVRQEREQKLATMTEEEKEVLYEEEKLEKKQEWAKKQVQNTTIVNCPQRNKVHDVPWHHAIKSSLVWAGVRFSRGGGQEL